MNAQDVLAFYVERENARWDEFAFIRERWNAAPYGGFSTLEQGEELWLLCMGGVTRADYAVALAALQNARDVWDPWAYMRTVMIRTRSVRTAEEVRALKAARAARAAEGAGL